MELFLIRGLPNSGKTSLARKLAQNVYAADDYFETKASVEKISYTQAYAKYHRDIAIAHAECITATRIALQFGMNVAVTNTFTTKWEIQPYIDLAKEIGVQITILTCERSPLATNKNDHNVPDFAIQRMKDRWEKLE